MKRLFSLALCTGILLLAQVAPQHALAIGTLSASTRSLDYDTSLFNAMYKDKIIFHEGFETGEIEYGSYYEFGDSSSLNTIETEPGYLTEGALAFHSDNSTKDSSQHIRYESMGYKTIELYFLPPSKESVEMRINFLPAALGVAPLRLEFDVNGSNTFLSMSAEGNEIVSEKFPRGEFVSLAVSPRFTSTGECILEILLDGHTLRASGLGALKTTLGGFEVSIHHKEGAISDIVLDEIYILSYAFLTMHMVNSYGKTMLGDVALTFPPNGFTFAFSLVGDCEMLSKNSTEPIFEMLNAQDMKIGLGTFVYSSKDVGVGLASNLTGNVNWDNTGWKGLLSEIASQGHDIGIMGGSSREASRADIQKALNDFTAQLQKNPDFWLDYDDLAQNLAADGAKSGSEHYIKDLVEANSNYIAPKNDRLGYPYPSLLDSQEPLIGGWTPENSSVSVGNTLRWSASDFSVESITFLTELKAKRGVHIGIERLSSMVTFQKNVGFPLTPAGAEAYLSANNDVHALDGTGVWKVEQGYRKAIERIGGEQGWTPAPSEIINRWRLWENIDASYANGILTVTNSNAADFAGATIVINGEGIEGLRHVETGKKYTLDSVNYLVLDIPGGTTSKYSTDLAGSSEGSGDGSEQETDLEDDYISKITRGFFTASSVLVFGGLLLVLGFLFVYGSGRYGTTNIIPGLRDVAKALRRWERKRSGEEEERSFQEMTPIYGKKSLREVERIGRKRRQQ